MNKIKSLFIGSIALLSTTSTSLFGLGIDLGPFSINLFPQGPVIAEQADNIDRPICYAIKTQKQLSMIVETDESPSSNEQKFVVKKIVVEPYAFGLSAENQPVLQGKVVKENVLKEVTIKYMGEKEEEDNSKYASMYKNMGYFSGLFSSRKDKTNVTTINFHKVKDFVVIEDSHFNLPEQFEVQEDITRVICKISKP